MWNTALQSKLQMYIFICQIFWCLFSNCIYYEQYCYGDLMYIKCFCPSKFTGFMPFYQFLLFVLFFNTRWVQLYFLYLFEVQIVWSIAYCFPCGFTKLAINEFISIELWLFRASKVPNGSFFISYIMFHWTWDVTSFSQALKCYAPNF